MNPGMTTNRRGFIQTGLLGSGAVALQATQATEAGQSTNRMAAEDLDGLKVTRVRFYHAPSRSMFNQSFHVCTVETNMGITGIGEGGSRDTIEQCAGLLIGENPSRIEHLWQLMYRGYFYPPGREKIHAQGALDLALWEIKGKALGLPVSQLLGGAVRRYLECYSTGFPSRGGTLKDAARGCMEAGFRAYRTSTVCSGNAFNPHHSVYLIGDTFLDPWCKGCGPIVEGHGPPTFIAAFFEDPFGWDVAGHIVGVGSDPKAVVIEFSLEAERIIHDGLPSEKYDGKGFAECPGLDRVRHVGCEGLTLIESRELNTGVVALGARSVTCFGSTLPFLARGQVCQREVDPR